MSHYLKSLANAFWVTVKQQLISCKYFVSRKTPRKFFPLNFRLTTEGLSKPSFKNPYPTNLLVNFRSLKLILYIPPNAFYVQCLFKRNQVFCFKFMKFMRAPAPPNITK